MFGIRGVTDMQGMLQDLVFNFFQQLNFKNDNFFSCLAYLISNFADFILGRKSQGKTVCLYIVHLILCILGNFS